MKGDLRLKVEKEDWDFAGADTQYLTHGLHSYPARMIPQIANRLIARYSTLGDIIWDPFAGSGTVLVECRLLGRNSYGTDINPLACLLARAKSTPIESSLLKKSAQRLQDVLIVDFEKLKKNELVPKIPDIFNLDYWFKPHVSQGLTIIKNRLAEIENPNLNDFFAVCFSATVRSVSNLRQDEFKLFRLAPEKLKSHSPDVLAVFLSFLKINIQKINEFSKKTTSDVFSKVYQTDLREAPIDNNCVNLIVTSPPYGDHKTTVAYGQFSRYSSLWLGFDEKLTKQVDRKGIGGTATKTFEHDLESDALVKTIRAIRNRDEKRARDTLAFFADLNDCLEKMYRTLASSGRCCIVIGNRTVKRIRIPTNLIVRELGEVIGFNHECTIPRNIPTKRMPWYNAPENVEGSKGETMSNENIILLQKNVG
ncbi:MAG: DNA methyltransferase [Candidatus Hermodarchaeota archaeon]